jgi:hypothetical protein
MDKLDELFPKPAKAKKPYKKESEHAKNRTIRVCDREWDLWKVKAHGEGLSLTDFIRKRCKRG